MRTERKVDAIVFDWLREGLEERLAELLRALEQLSEGHNATEHVFDATQALQTLDSVFSMIDAQLVRVLVHTQLAALEPLEADRHDESAVSAQIESAVLLQALLDRMAAGAELTPASLQPMVNRLRATMEQPPLAARELAARALLLQVGHDLNQRPDGPGSADAQAELRPLLRQVEREVLAVMRDDWSVLPRLRDLSMQIIAHEPSRGATVAILVANDLFRLTESDPDRYGLILKRAVGRVLQLFRLQLQAHSEVVLNHAGLDLAASILLSILEQADDQEVICRDTAAEWKAQLACADAPAQFVGLDAESLIAAQQALKEELLSTQDVLDLFVRGKRDDLEPLGRILSNFEQMTGVLDTLDYTAAAEALAAGRERLLSVTRGEQLLDDALLMDLAGTVMLVEQVIDGIPRDMAGGGRAASLHDQTVASSIAAIASAATVSLGEAREKVNTGLSGGETADRDPFAQAAEMLTGIGEVLRLSGREAATPLVMALARWSRAQTFGQPIDDEQTLSALSEIFAALEFYLENLRDFQKEIARFLEVPKRRIEDLLAALDEGDVSAPTVDEVPTETVPVQPETVRSDEPVGRMEIAPVDEGQAVSDELLAFWQVEQDEVTPEDEEREGWPVEASDLAATSVTEPADLTGDEQPLVTVDHSPDVGEEDQWLTLTDEATEALPDLALTARDELQADSIEQADDERFAASLAEEGVSEPLQALEWPQAEQPEHAVPTDDQTIGEEPSVTGDDELVADLLDESDAVEAATLTSRPAEDQALPVEAEATPESEPAEDPMMAEMREVFAEEMLEMVPDLAAAAADWQAAADSEALIRLRRGFHTIKGSGRMVGLDTIGDWAWSWEHLLNEVIDEKIEGDGAIRAGAVEAVDLMRAVLPELESGRMVPESHWSASRQLAERFAAGEPLVAADEVDPIAAPPATEPMSEAEVAVPHAPAPVIADPVLREIFEQEVGGYIDELQRNIAAARDHGVGLACDKELVRLLHTTLGSARTAGVDVIAELASHLEDWARIVSEHHERLGGEDLALFADGIDAIEVLRRWAVDPTLEQPDSSGLEARLHARLQTVMAEYGERAESREDEALVVDTPEGAEAREPADALIATDESQQEAQEEAAPSSREPVLDPAMVLDRREEVPAEDASDVAEVDLAVSTGDWFERGQGVPVSEFGIPMSEDEGYADDIEQRPDDDPTEQDEDILQIFLDEADELLEEADSYIDHWRAHPENLDSIRLLNRNLHTLKGGARMAGLLNLGDVAHHLEGRLGLARRKGTEDKAALISLVQHSYDVIADLLDRVHEQQPVPQQRELVSLIRDPDGARRFAERGSVERVDEAEPVVSVPTSVDSIEGKAAEPDTSPVQAAAPAERREEQIRVAAGSIDALVNQTGESVLLQSRIDRQVSGFERQLFELQQTVTRLRSQLRRLEIETETQIKADLMEEAGVTEDQFDPLEFDRFTQVQELSRGIMESLGDVASIEESLSSLTEQFQLLLLQQSRLGRKMQDGVLAMRLVRFNDVAGRLRRIVRQVGDEMGRPAELRIEHGDTEIDRVTLTALLPSLEHMLRNSIAHGIEPLEERRAQQKPPVGRLVIAVDSGGGNITISLRDDGRGLDLDSFRRKAVERGLVPADLEISDEEARSLIFLPGFSTAGSLSQVAGRGVGMDVVASTTRELGGFIDIDSEPGRYTEIRLNLPLTQAMTRGILVAGGEDRYAIPYKGLVAVTRMTGVSLVEHYRAETPQIEYNGEDFPLYYLGELLWGQPPPETGQDVAAIRPVLLFKLGERRFALHVDRQLGGIQLFVKSLGPQLGRVPGLSGATIADDGDVILVLELFELAQQFQRRDYQRGLEDRSRPKPQRARPSVLVVDDSLTVRRVTERTLERNNYDVLLARDGVEALGLLQDSLPDLVLTDIEMPRMDGFELLGAIRNDPATRDTPVVMISSRTGQKHRARADDLGVSAYLGKPYTESDLIDTVERLLPSTSADREALTTGEENVD